MATRETEIQAPAGNPANAVNVGDIERLVSVAGGGALAAYGLKKGGAAGALLAAAGGALIYRGATGHCHLCAALGRNPEDTAQFQLKVQASYTINCEPSQLYSLWRRLENLPNLMTHLESVKELGDGRSHWVAKAPAGRTVEWDAEIINDVPNETIAWRSVPGSGLQNAGAVRFQRAPGNRGTELWVTLQYNPPGGKAGAMVAKLMGEEPQVQLADDLRHLKQMIEAGEVSTNEGQPNGKAPFPQESMAVAAAHPSR